MGAEMAGGKQPGVQLPVQLTARPLAQRPLPRPQNHPSQERLQREPLQGPPCLRLLMRAHRPGDPRLTMKADQRVVGPA